MLEKFLLIVVGSIIGSYLTSRIEVWKAWNSYDVVRLEIDRNLQLLESVHAVAIPTYGHADNQQKQIDELIDTCEDKLPVRIRLLVGEKMPLWSYRAWETQINLLSQILTETQIKGIFNIQVGLERLSSIHESISNLITIHGDSSRDRAIELWDEWESIINRMLQNNNPLRPVNTYMKIASIIGLRWLMGHRNLPSS